MGLFNKQRTDGATYDGQGEERRGLVDVIQYNGEADDLVWKFPYNNITTGARLVVNESQQALFVKGGVVCDLIGAGTHTLSAGNLPILGKIVNLPFGGRTPFVAEVWYFNMTAKRGLKFGTPAPIEILDPLYHVYIPVRSFGQFGMRVTDPSLLYTELVGTQHLTTTDYIVENFRSTIVRSLTDVVGTVLQAERISVVQLAGNLGRMSRAVQESLNAEVERYGLRVENLDIMSFNFPKDDPNVQKVLAAHAEAATTDVLSEAKARQRAREGEGYWRDRPFEVAEQAAQNSGTANQIMGVGLGAGMGWSMGGAMGNSLAGMVQQTQMATPPPLPVQQFFVAVAGGQQGPYDLNAMRIMAQQGSLTPDAMVWTAGMAGWDKASACAALASLFASMPPTPPPPPMA